MTKLFCNIKHLTTLVGRYRRSIYDAHFAYRPTYLGIMPGTTVIIYYIHYSSKILVCINAFEAAHVWI
jgi:hypothetical protein